MPNTQYKESDFYKSNPNNKVWWVNSDDTYGDFLFSFDKKEVFNMFRDYPDKLTPEQKKIFDKENPDLAELF